MKYGYNFSRTKSITLTNPMIVRLNHNMNKHSSKSDVVYYFSKDFINLITRAQQIVVYDKEILDIDLTNPQVWISSVD